MENEMNDTWFIINNIQEVDSPALVVYPDRVKENIRILTGMIDDINRLRPHVKTNKSREATQLMMQAGIQKFKCATIAEAEMLGICRAKDVLLAYPIQGPKIGRLIELSERYTGTKYSALVDNINSAKQIATLFNAKMRKANIYLDLNVGMNRTGIVPDEKALQLYLACTEIKGIQMEGLHVYDGHLRNPDIKIRKAECDKTFEKVEWLQQKIIEKGIKKPVIVIGGSLTFPIHSKRQEVECSPGTFIFWDRGYTLISPEQKFEPAALVISRVISLPDETKICLDLGHKSIASENELQKRVYFINAPDLRFVSQSEEHLVADAGADHKFQPGDVLYGIPYHICPTVALYERAIAIEKNRSMGEWRIIGRARRVII